VYDKTICTISSVVGGAHSLPPPNGALSLDDVPVTQALKLTPRLSPFEVAPKLADGAQSYSCFISTLLEDSEEGNYWNAVYWVEYPTAAVQAANGKVAKRAFVLGSKDAGSKAQNLGDLKNIVRLASCDMPDSKLAENLLLNELKKFGLGSWIESNPNARNAKTTSSPLTTTQSINDSWLHCNEWWVGLTCVKVIENGQPIMDCWVNEIRCLDWVVVWDEPDYGVSGGYPAGWESLLPAEGCEPFDLCYLGPNGEEYTMPFDACYGTNPPVRCTDPCSIGNTNSTLANYSVQEALEKLWIDSNFGSTGNPNPESQRMEVYGFLVPRTTGSGYDFLEWGSPPNEQGPCRVSVANIQDLPPGSIFVHTHPYTNGEVQQHCLDDFSPTYNNEVGAEDRQTLTALGLDSGIIIDADKIIFYDDNSSNDTSFIRCGY
jgi:hypothetical protein